MKITKQRLIEIIKEEVHKLNEGGEKTYKSLMNLEKGIKDLEKLNLYHHPILQF